MATIFAGIQSILDAIANKNGNIADSPHGVFWRQTGNYDSDYTSFTTGQVPNIGVPIIDPSNPKNSNFFVILINPDGVQGFPQCRPMDLLPPPLTFPAVSSTLPYDITLPNDLSVDNLQRAFDIFSWATFIALNWPANSDGTPMPVSIGSNLTAERVWETWLTPDQVFKSNGSPPDVPGGRNGFVAALVPNAKPGVRVLNYTTKVLNLGAAGVEKIISNVKASKAFEASPADALADLSEIDQANFGRSSLLPPIADLNSKYVFYDSHLNPVEYQYITANGLYSASGQTAFLKTNAISFPSGTPTIRHMALSRSKLRGSNWAMEMILRNSTRSRRLSSIP
jgi:hypothetical protein